MINKNLGIVKYVSIVLLLFFGITSCEKEIENIGVDLVDNGYFGIGDSIIEVTAYNVNVDSSRVDNNSDQYIPISLMGVNRNDNFGKLKSDIPFQLSLPAYGVDFGDNVVIDLVVLDLPYFSTRDTVQYAKDPITGEIISDEDGNSIITPSFVLDSVYGNQDIEYQVRVSQLETFLNILDPEDPTKVKTYYSDRDYEKSYDLYTGMFKPDRNDTVLYVERRYLDINEDPSTIDDIDTIKTSTASPSMKFYLDKNFFYTNFVEQQNSSVFDNNDNFVQYFKGLFIESEGDDGSLINFYIENSNMTIYYSSDSTVDEGTDEDLNGNGVTGEVDVVVKTKKAMVFYGSGVKAGKYTRDYSGSIVENKVLNPDKVNGEDYLYVQGAAGTNAVIQLFTEESLAQVRSENWLINEANLTLYIDDGMQKGELPSQLFLYKYADNTILDDVKLNGTDVFGGFLNYDDNGDPESYKFRITRHVSDILEDVDSEEIPKVVLKTFNATDQVGLGLLDTITKDYSYIPKGVVLKGNLPNSNDKRLKLEIYYSK